MVGTFWLCGVYARAWYSEIEGGADLPFDVPSVAMQMSSPSAHVAQLVLLLRQF